MDFRSIYEHGFARVAACTGRVAIADPPANAEAVLRQARACARGGRRGRAVPRARPDAATRSRTCCCRTRCSTASRRRWRRSSRARPTCCRCSSSARRCATATGSTTAPSSCTAAGCSASCRSPTCRPTASSTSAARSPRATTSAATIRVGGDDVPFGPDLLFAAEDVPGLVVHVEVCEDLWVPVPPSAEAALAGATVLLNLSGSPITVGRAEDRKLLCRSQSSRCLAAYVYAAAGQGESTTDLSWDGQTMIYENGVLLAETERFPTATAARSPTSTSTCCARSGMRMGTFDDNRRTHAERTGDVPPDRPSRSTRRTATSACGARLERFPFVPADPDRLEQDCYEAYNIQVAGLQQRLRGDRRPEGRHRRLRRPRLHARADRRRPGDGPRRAPAQRHPRLHAARLRHQRRDEGQRPQADATRSASRPRSSTSRRPRG